MSVTSKRESQLCSAGKHFWQMNLQNRKTKRAKTSVTAELCHYTQVRKIDPMVRSVIFLKLIEKGGKK